ncbi:MAG: M56 family metallopeptidase [Eubacteriales bacterium]|nr:M56 family metallopeptidase [Eubacteriales bacterium]
MQAIFAKILNMSLTGSIVIAVVLLAWLCLKRQPKIYSYALWAVVLFRLLCPLSITAGLSVLKPIPVTTTPGISSVSYQPVQQAVSYSRAVAQAQQEQTAVQEAEEPKKVASPMEIAAYIWLGGASIMALYSVAQYLTLRRRLTEAIPYQGEVYLADSIASPFVMGVFHPKIYLPSGTPEEERRFILAHERHHIRRGDHLWKLLGYAALCLHWFNPLVWLAFNLAGKDMEMSCDEAVIRQLGEDVRADYSQALLRLATHNKTIAGMPLAFGEGDTKGRVRNMARWKKPKVCVSVVCVIVCIVIAAACALNPRQSETSSEELRQTVGPATIIIGDLRFKVSEGCIVEIRDKETYKQTDNGLDVSYWVFLDEETAVGGVNTFRIPDNYSADSWDWLKSLDFSEWLKSLDPSQWQDEIIDWQFAASAPGSIAALEFHNDEWTVHSQHNLYSYEDWIYDLWFDKLTVKPEVMEAILDSVSLSKPQAAAIPLDVDAPPAGITYELAPNGIFYIVEDGPAIGEIVRYEIPETVRNPYADYTWLADVGIPDMHNDSLLQSASGSEYGDWEIRFESDVPPGEERMIDHYHTFFIQDNVVYDVWFDFRLTNEKTMDTVLKALTGSNEMLISLPYVIGTLPNGITSETASDGSLTFWKGTSAVGGLSGYPIPDGVYDPNDKAFVWLEDVGIPDLEDPDLTISGMFFWRDSNGCSVTVVDDLENPTVQRSHSFRVAGNMVYDFWMDEIQLDTDEQNALSKAVEYVEPSVQSTEPSETPEDIAFARAQAVMNGLQDSPVLLQTQCRYQNTPEKNCIETFCYDSEIGFLRFTTNADGRNLGELYGNDRYFTSETSGGAQWRETEPPQEWGGPWLGNFNFIRHYVTYMDTLSGEEGDSYLFRIDALFEDTEDAAPCYFATFRYDSDGNFVEVYLQINPGRDDAYTLTESIITTDAQEIAAKLESECQRAIQ